MRYYYEKPDNSIPMYGEPYKCSNPLCRYYTLYLINGKGLGIVQKRFDQKNKYYYWDALDSWLANDIYLQAGFMNYFNKHAAPGHNGQYPVVSARKVMWALRMKPLKKEYWERDI